MPTKFNQFITCMEKQKQMLITFQNCKNIEDRYKMIITMGREQKPLLSKYKTNENLVKGCQSTMYLYSYAKDGLLYFESESEALISSGLAILLTKIYSGEKPETILKCPPKYLEELSIHASLSPSRSNGLASLHLRMKQEALKYFSTHSTINPS